MPVELPSADAKLAGITSLARVQLTVVQDVFRTKKSGKKKKAIFHYILIQSVNAIQYINEVRP